MEIRKIEDVSSESRENFHPLRKIVIIIVFLLFVASVWLFLAHIIGGRSQNSATGNATSTDKKITIGTEKSLYNGWVKITDTSAAQETYPQKEYIAITVVQQNLSNIDATHWILVNQSGENAKLGDIAELPVFGKINTLSPLKINGGDILLVSTGVSPIGVSFRMNKCMPYFEQFQDFIPAIPTDECPYTMGDKGFISLDSGCQNFISTIPMCQTIARKLPSTVSSACKAYIDAHVNYRGCVADNQDTSKFYSNEVRIFLGKDHEMWGVSDTVILLDESGKIIDSVKY